jgi:hypothetical protein
MMAHIALPIAAGVVDQSFSIKLDGAVYHFRLRYITRAAVWVLSIGAADAAPIASGLVVRLGVDLLAQFSDDRFPPGRLFALNFVDPYVEAGRDNFGRDVALIYAEG